MAPRNTMISQWGWVGVQGWGTGVGRQGWGTGVGGQGWERANLAKLACAHVFYSMVSKALDSNHCL